MDVATTLEAVSQAVQRGAFDEAREIGNAAAIPLAISSSDVELGVRLHDTPQSSVYQGRFQEQDVAVKRCKIGRAADLQSFRQEVALLAQLNHPGIARLLAVKAVPPDYLMVVPLEETDLHDRLHEQGWRPDPEQLVQLALQLADACVHIHRKGIVHRDIKPANVLLAADGSAKLTDFGIAELAEVLAEGSAGQRTLHNASKPTGGFHKRDMVGTLEYMAPEVLLKQPGSFASDVYAFGVTVNELASGVFPFSDCTRDNPKAHTILDMGYGRQELAAAVVGEGLRPLQPAGLPPALALLLDRCWAADPHERPSFVQIADELRHIQAKLEAEQQQTWQGSSAQAGQQQRNHNVAAASLPKGLPIASDSNSAAAEDDSRPTWHSPVWAASPAAATHVHVQVSAGAYATAGLRGEDAMEDRHIVSTGLAPDGQGTLLAVFDGHRGPQAAEFAAEHFESTLLRHWAAAGSAAQALVAAFLDVDAAFRRCHAATGPQQWAGCTSLASLVWGGRLWVANAGDCRAVLCRGGEVVPASRDHTAELDAERQRVLDAGGTASRQRGMWRVGDIGLAVTRSIGDADLKGVGVTAEPEVTEFQLQPDDTFLILASDGLWDVLSNYDAVGLVHDTVKQPTMCAQRLVTEALTRGSKDNITAVVAFLQPVQSLELIFSEGRQKYAATRTHYGSRTTV